MAFNMSQGDSAIKLSAQQEAEVAQMNSVSEIQEAMRRFALEQNLLVPDAFDHSILHEVERPNIPASTRQAKVLNINGQKHIIEADSPDGLVKAELAKMRELFGGKAATTTTEETDERPRNERGQFITHDPEAVALAPSVTAALEASGISVDELRAFTSARRTERAIGDWQSATTAFHEQHPDWQGGRKNTEIISQILVKQHLENAPDKLAALNAAVDYARKNNLLVENEDIALANKVNAVSSYEELKSKIGYKGYDASSGIWGR